MLPPNVSCQYYFCSSPPRSRLYALGWYFGERDTKDKHTIMDQDTFDQRGTWIDKALSVQWDSNADAMRDANANDAAKEDMKIMQTNMKYGLFCLTFSYFKAIHCLRKEKASWDGSHDLVSLRQGPSQSEERKKMIREEQNAQLRKNRLDYAMKKARAGEERKKQRLEKEHLEKVWQSCVYVCFCGSYRID